MRERGPGDGPGRQLRTWALRRLTVALLGALFVVALLAAVPSLREVLDEIARMRASWVAGAIAFEIASCAGFVVVFRLFFSALGAREARRLAWVEMGSGALLPGGGVGGLAVGGWLMHLVGVSSREIVERSSALFFLTSAVNVAAMVLAGVLLAGGVLPGDAGVWRDVAPVLAACLATAVVLALPALARRETSGGGPRRAWVADLVAGIRDAERALVRPSWRLAGAVGYLGFDVAVLWCTFAALGHPPSVAPLVLAYLVGYLANVAPLPGGVGVLDAGLVGALVLYGFPAIRSTAAVLVYHAIAFWTPGLGGLLGLGLLRANRGGPVRP